MKSGASQRDVNVLVREGRIVSVGRGAVPSGATVVDGCGKYLIPQN